VVDAPSEFRFSQVFEQVGAAKDLPELLEGIVQFFLPGPTGQSPKINDGDIRPSMIETTTRCMSTKCFAIKSSLISSTENIIDGGIGFCAEFVDLEIFPPGDTRHELDPKKVVMSLDIR
jgi:hypothetical protein